MRTFETGATRDAEGTKPDYEGFFSPLVFEAFGEYMTKHRVQADGSLRASDNWQKGIPQPVYIKSLFRHFVHMWALHRGHAVKDDTGQPVTMRDTLCAVMFNVMGYLHESLKRPVEPGFPPPDLTPFPCSNSGAMGTCHRCGGFTYRTISNGESSTYQYECQICASRPSQ